MSENTNKKIVLIDGHSILNRAFFGLPDLTNSEGLHTNAIYGFLTIMFKILDEEKPDYLTVAFDVHAPTFRHKMYDAYKGTRKPMADELRQQVPVIKEVLCSMGIKTIECAGLEADDLLGTLSRRCEEKGMEVSVISGDRDLLQLATQHVKIRIPKTKQGRTEVEDYYAADVSELKPPRASKALAEHWDMAVMSKTLATIEVHADFPYELSEAKLGNIFTEEAYAFFQKLQFKNLLPKFDVTAPANQVEDGFEQITDYKKAEKVLNQAKESTCVGAVIFQNTENVLPLFANEAAIGGIGLCFDEEHAYCIEVTEQITKEFLLEKLSKLNESCGRFVMFDIKEAMKWLPIKNQKHCFDATVAAYLLNPLKNDYTYEDVAREQLNIVIEEKSEAYVKVCYEAYTAFKGSDLLYKKLEETQMLHLFENIEMPLVFTLYDMERNGIRAEGEALKVYSSQLGGRISELEKEIYEMAGESFNINSPKQLGVILFEKLLLPGSKKTKSGYSTAASVLDKLAPDYPIVSKVLEYRQLTKLKSTYADGLVNYIEEDGRIHSKFNQTITATGRISSTEPNLQNIPVRVELGRLIRKVFVPEDGYIFVDADYSQIELRVLAHCSGDANLIEAYREEKDIHRITASQVFHIPFEEVTPLQRRNAKAVNFGIVYGISSFGLSEDLSIGRKEAAKYIEDYFKTYPGIKTFLDDTVAHAKEMGYVVTLFGRRRPVPELSSSNFMQRSFGERVAMNAPIQGTAADIMKIAMIGVNRRLKEQNLKSRLVLQVHDELLIEAYRPELPEVEKILREEMEQAASLDVPLEIDMHTGENWYEAK